ncbi:response regulator transcription factor [Nocardia sp. NPDC051570]|uniref:response regulator transcription factor n=1 Tax=Nocardia sp. NPDC051570 TaxID=3364324 RepID=UPI0037BAC4A0
MDSGNFDETITVMLFDDCSITRAGVRAIIGNHADIDISDEVSDVATAVRQINDDAPDVVVVNAHSGALEPEQVVDHLRAECPHWPGRFLVIVTDGSAHSFSGTVGTLMRQATPKEFVLALRMVAAGYSLSPSFGPTRPAESAVGLLDAALSSEQLESITRRESDVLRLLAQGRTNAEISKILVLSESTVKSHVQHLLTKLGMRNRVSAAIYAYESGIVHLDRRAIP